MYPKRVSRVRISLSPQPVAAQRFSAGLFWCMADGELAHRTSYTETDRTTVRSLGCNWVARTPREGTEIAAAPAAGISPLPRQRGKILPSAGNVPKRWTLPAKEALNAGVVPENGTLPALDSKDLESLFHNDSSKTTRSTKKREVA